MTCQQATLSLGVYVLGALDRAERHDLEEHLHSCPSCRDELAGLAGLPGLLAQVSVADLQAGLPALPADGYQRLAARAGQSTQRRHRRSRRWVAAAAAAVLIAGAGLGVRAWQEHRPATASYAATAGPVRMQVQLTGQARGTGLDVTVSGLPAEERCRLVAVARDGTRATAGSWEATYTGKVWVKGATTIPRAQLAELVLFGTTGRRLVAVHL